MDCSVYKEHKRTIAYGTRVSHMGHCLIVALQQTCLEPKSFHLILQLGGTYAVMGRESHDSSLRLTASSTVYGTHTSPHLF